MEPGWQESNWGAPANTKQTSWCQLTARNVMSDSSQRHGSQIWTALRHFISVWWLREARKTGWADCFFFFFYMRFHTGRRVPTSFWKRRKRRWKRCIIGKGGFISIHNIPLCELHFTVHSHKWLSISKFKKQNSRSFWFIERVSQRKSHKTRKTNKQKKNFQVAFLRKEHMFSPLAVKKGLALASDWSMIFSCLLTSAMFGWSQKQQGH